MWQEILAIDSQRSMDPSCRPLYLKRRLQLLQALQQQQQSTSTSSAKMEFGVGSYAPDERDEATKVVHRPVMRSRKYLSLRVKLLKRQFGLPSDLMSLQSMSISTTNSHHHHRRAAIASAAAAAAASSSSDMNENAMSGLSGTIDEADGSSEQDLHDSASMSGMSAVERSSYNGVHRVYPASTDRGPITCVRFAHNTADFFVTAAFDGSLVIHNLVTDPSASDADRYLRGHSGPVIDFDLSQSDEFIVSGSYDGSLILWHTHTGNLVRRLGRETFAGGSAASAPLQISACRFVPSNNNLVVTLMQQSVNILNISTGKFTGATCSLIQGKTLSVELNELGSLMWVGNDRGYIESFRLDSNLNKIQKGCRYLASTSNRPVTSLSTHTHIKKLTAASAVLMATMATEDIHLFAVIDGFGSISPLRCVSAGNNSLVRCSIFSRLILFHQGTLAVAGAKDGSLLFFDVERDAKPCINRLLGHSSCVIGVTFSQNEKFLVSVDDSGQVIVWKKS